MTRKVICAIFLLASVAAAQPKRADPPALPQSGMPFLATDAQGGVLLSWIDPAPKDQNSLRYAKWTGAGWSAANTIASGKNWFINWADFPAIAALPDGSLLAHWLTRNAGAKSYGYGLRVARKAGGSEQWNQIFSASLDNTSDYAGFLSFAVNGNSAGAIYLAPPPDAPKTGPKGNAHDGDDEVEHRKTLRYVSFAPDGKVLHDRELDADTCSCCQTTVVPTSKGVLAAYRDHLDGEIRDIAVTRMVDGVWTRPEPLHRDGWKINACPTDGPSAAARGDNVAVAWFTRAQDKPRVQLALSSDAGVTFSEPVRLDDGNPVGRASASVFDDASYLIAWLERREDGKADLRLRRVDRGGAKHPSVTAATVSAGRSTGLPRLVVSGDQIILAWRDEQVRAAWYSRADYLRLEQKH